MVVFTHKEKEKEKWASRVFVRIIMPSNITIKWSIIVKKGGKLKMRRGKILEDSWLLGFLYYINKGFYAISGLISRGLRYL